MALYHLKKGSVNYTVVGAPTIVDGVASGFSNELPYSYLQVNGFSFANPFEIKCRFQYKTCFALIFGIANENGSVVLASTNIRVQLYAGKRITVSNSMVENTWYKFIYTYDGNQTYSLSLYDDNDTLIGTATDTSETALPQTNFIRIGSIRAASLGGTFPGSIDLNHTYITVNGQPWFGVCPFEVQKHQIRGPIGYTVVGSPMITEGIASGFSGSDYLQLQSFPSVTNITSYEFFCKATIGADISTRQELIAYRTSNLSGIEIYGGHIRWRVARYSGLTNDFEIVSSPLDISQSDTVLIHCSYKGSDTYSLRVSKDNGITWIESTATPANALATIDTTRAFSLGVSFVQTFPFDGSIDLNSTYIKVDGKLWFWQPQETKRIVVNGVEVWRKAQ